MAQEVHSAIGDERRETREERGEERREREREQTLSSCHFLVRVNTCSFSFFVVLVSWTNDLVAPHCDIVSVCLSVFFFLIFGLG